MCFLQWILKLNTCCQLSNAAELRFKQNSERDTPQKRLVVFGRCLSVWDCVFQGAKLLLVSVSRKHLKKKKTSHHRFKSSPPKVISCFKTQSFNSRTKKSLKTLRCISWSASKRCVICPQWRSSGLMRMGRMDDGERLCLEKWMVYV